MWSETESNLSSKYYSYRPQKFAGWVKLRTIASIDPSRRLDYNQEFIDYVGLAETDNLAITTILHRPYSEVKGRRIIKNGDILFARIEPSIFNKKYILVNNLQNDTLASTEFNIIQAKDADDAKYILYMLLSDMVYKQFFGKLTGSTGRRRLDKTVLKNIWIPYPKKETRQQIVSIMDNAFQTKAENLKLASNELKSIDTFIINELGIQLPNLNNSFKNRKFISASSNINGERFDGFYNRPEFIDFHNKILKQSNGLTLKNVLYGVNGVTYTAEDEQEHGHVILRANNIDIENNELDLSDLKYINDSLLLPDKQKLCCGDILMCSASGSKSHAGKVAFIPEDMPYYFGGFMTVLRPYTPLNTRYIFEYMCSSIYRTLLFRRLGGTNINNVNYTLIKNIPVIMPDIKTQDKIVKNALSIRKKINLYKKNALKCIIDAQKQVEKIIIGESHV